MIVLESFIHLLGIITLSLLATLLINAIVNRLRSAYRRFTTKPLLTFVIASMIVMLIPTVGSIIVL